MRSFFKVAVIGLGTLVSISAAEAMPAATSLIAAPADGALIQKTVVIVTKRVVRRPRVIVHRRVVRKVIVR